MGNQMLYKQDRDVTEELQSLVEGDELLEAWDNFCKEKTGKGFIRYADLAPHFPQGGKIGTLKLGSDSTKLLSPDALPDSLFMRLYRKQQEAESNGVKRPSLYVVKEQIKDRLQKAASEKLECDLFFDYQPPEGGRYDFADVSFSEHWTSEKDRQKAEYNRQKARSNAAEQRIAVTQRSADQAPPL